MSFPCGILREVREQAQDTFRHGLPEHSGQVFVPAARDDRERGAVRSRDVSGHDGAVLEHGIQQAEKV